MNVMDSIISNQSNKEKSKVFLKNQVYVVHHQLNSGYKEIWKHDGRRKSGGELVGIISNDVYRVKNESEQFVNVDFEGFLEYLNNSGYKKPIGQWGNDEGVYSIEDYRMGIIKDGETLSIVLNKLYTELGLELVVLDFDLKSVRDEYRNTIDEKIVEISHYRDILKTPNGYHVVLTREEYNRLLEKFGLSDESIKTTSNKVVLYDVEVSVDIFRTWKDVRYILIPTKGSIREMLGGGVLRNGNLVKDNAPADILDVFLNIKSDDRFFASISGAISSINSVDEMDVVGKEFKNAVSSNRESAIGDLCNALGIRNLSDFTIDVLCQNILKVGDVDGTGRYDKVLRLFYYYILSKLVKNTKSFSDMKNNYQNVLIYENDDEQKVYSALESVYPNHNQLLSRVDSFIKRINYHRDNIARKMYEGVYNAIKKHMKKSKSVINISIDGRIVIGKDWDIDDLARVMSDLGVRRYDNNTIVDGFLYYSVEQFKKYNKYTSRAIPDALVGFHTSRHMKRLAYEHKGRYYTEFKLIPSGVTHYYDSEKKEHLMFFRNRKGSVICLRFGESGVYREDLSKINRPIFNRYLLAVDDYENMKMTLPKVNEKVIKDLIYDKEKSRKFLEMLLDKIFDYYSFDLSNEKNDRIVKHALVASVLSDAGFIIQIVGASGTGKSVLASALSYLGSFSNSVGAMTINDNVDEIWYKILENHSMGNIVMIDEIPKDIKEQLQTAFLSLVTSKSHRFRYKYSKHTTEINLPVKIITTSTSPTSWVADAVRRSVILNVYRSHKKGTEIKTGDVEGYYNTVKDFKIYARVAYYSMISNVKIEDDEYIEMLKSINIPDDLKNILYKYFKSLGYDIKDVLATFNEVNRTQESLNPLIENILDAVASKEFKDFLYKNGNIFKKVDNSFRISYKDFVRILYSMGMVKNEMTEEYLYFSSTQNTIDQVPLPDPSDFEETYFKLLQNNDELSQKINKKVEDLVKTRGFTKKMDELFAVYINFKSERGIKRLEKTKISKTTYVLVEYYDENSNLDTPADTPPDTPTDTPPQTPPSTPTPDDTPPLSSNQLSDIDIRLGVDERGYPRFWDEPISMTTTEQKSLEQNQETETKLAITKDIFNISADEEPDARAEMLSVYVSVLRDMLYRDVSMYKNPRKVEEQALNVVLTRMQRYSTFRWLREEFEKYLDSIKKECITVVPSVKVLSADEANRLLSKYNVADGLEKFFKALHTTKLNNVERYVATVLFVACMYNFNRFLKNGKVDSFLVPEVLLGVV